MLSVQQQRAEQLAETEKKIKEILARRGEGEYDPDQQVVSFDGFVPTEIKDLDKMTKDELITLAKGHIKGIRNLKKAELLKQIKQFMVANPGKILLGTEAALGGNGDDAGAEEETPMGEEEDKEASVEPSTLGTDFVSDNSDASKTCSILECDGSNIEGLVWCDACELWFCRDLHGPHLSHSAQTHFKAGRVPKSVEDMSVDNEDHSIRDNIENIVEQRPPSEDAQVTRHKRKCSELVLTLQPEEAIDLSRVGVATRKLREILTKPSKNQKVQLRSALNFTSYDIIFLTWVAKDFGIDISIVANKSRASRLEVLDYLLSMLN